MAATLETELSGPFAPASLSFLSASRWEGLPAASSHALPAARPRITVSPARPAFRLQALSLMQTRCGLPFLAENFPWPAPTPFLFLLLTEPL